MGSTIIVKVCACACVYTYICKEKLWKVNWKRNPLTTAEWMPVGREEENGIEAGRYDTRLFTGWFHQLNFN